MNPVCLRVILTICLISFPFLARGQEKDEFRIENITSEYIRIEKGLSQNSVFCIHQDKEGFLWFGTWSGLNRFDGYQFRVLSNNVYDPDKGLTNPTILGLTEDTLGHIWAATLKGLNKIRKSDLTITQFTVGNARGLGMVTDSLTTMFGDSYGKIWIGTNKGILILDPGSSRFVHIEHNPRDNRTISSNLINCFEEDSSGNIWVGTDYGLNRISRRSGQIIRYLNDQHINCLESDLKGNLWIGTSKQLLRFNNVSRDFKVIPFLWTQSGINTLYLFKNKLWIGTAQSGAWIMDPASQNYENLKDRISGSRFHEYINIHAITSDRNGLIWLGLSHRGLVKLIPDPYAFTSLANGYSIFGVAEPFPNKLWFGTQEGLLEVDRISRSSRMVKTSDDLKNPISSNQITNLIPDGQDIWICTQNGLNRLNLKTGKIRVFTKQNNDNSIAGNWIWDVIKASDGSYWFATQTGLTNWNPTTDIFTNHRHQPGNPNSLSNNFCLSVIEEKPGIFLVSTQFGLNRLDVKNGSWTHFLPIPGDLTSISSSYIFGVFRDSHDDLWVYTNGGGIAKFDGETGTFLNYGTYEGLPDNIVYGVDEDRDGILWLITNNGLCRFDPALERFTNFDVNDGLLSNEFNVNGILNRENGEMVLCGVQGGLSFFPHKAWRSSEMPVMQLSRFRVHVGNQSVDIPIHDSIRLRHDENTISIDFSCMDFLYPFKNQYQYRLIGYDNDWTKLPVGAHQAEYRKIKPGHYSFQVKGTNSLGLTGPQKEVSIRIIPAWYQTPLFKITSTLLALALVAFLILLRLIHLRNRHEMEKQLLTTQTELIRSQKFALRSQMNPHFIFNSLNSIQNFILKNDVDSANYYLSNFSSLMRKVLEFSLYNYITLAEEIELINLYLKMEKLRFSKKFDIQIRIDSAIDQHLIKIPPMLLQPYLENAILHGLQLTPYKGLLKIEIQDHSDHMEIQIEDNGIGRERARAIRERTGHKSKGLANIEKRIQLYNKISLKPLSVNIDDLKNEKGEASGTRIRLVIPYEMEEQTEEI